MTNLSLKTKQKTRDNQRKKKTDRKKNPEVETTFSRYREEEIVEGLRLEVSRLNKPNAKQVVERVKKKKIYM